MRLFKHQREAVRFMEERDRGALLMEMGTGKTRTVLEYLNRTKHFPVLIVTPKSVMSSWENELELYPDIRAAVIDGKREKRLELLDGSFDLFVINYEYLWPILPQLLKKKFDTIVFDESTMIKSPKAKRTKSAIRLADDSQRVFILTGSPISNSPLDAYCQFRTLGPDVLGDNYWEFRNYHAILGGYEFHEVIGYNDLEALTNRLSEFSFVRTKDECLDLPPKLFEDRRVSMLPEQKEIYRKVRKDLLLELKGKSFLVGSAMTKMIRLSQITGGHLTMEDYSLIEFPTSKDREIERILEESGNQKVVIWVRFLYELNKLKHLLKKHGVLTMSGKTKDRKGVIKSFQTDPSFRVLVCQIQTGKFGITLTAGTIAIYYSKTYSLEDYLQSQDRIHRIGQDQPVTIINLNARASIDISLQRALDRKKDLADLVTPTSLSALTSGSQSI